ncbi:uncharacterized protein Z518_03460 [Rhinocladiella mackenziei CBS 650.93]|uniref:Uncharacterized protein n=1 Tax=Rhinocladiella mackenziei CBS 650.93 TaxID=1442369 RepID=A0A0D2HE08_9EURO|nr:uncharacterized protein Z518_03460 [Rhinocladiella mackenziei CBS 650.93]KIX08803.1 hypothetical protein Z518_03460 [Rhinocladiella mackenziei CBS 650.93]
MATRPLFLGLASAARSGVLTLPRRTPARRCLCVSAARPASTVATSTPTSSSMVNQIPPSPAGPAQADDVNETKHSAFLGEADSNDGHEAFRDTYGRRQPALEADNAAFLGEADSDDAFEVQRAAEGDKHESMDAQNAAFLGEADSDDGFEALRAAEGDKRESLDAHNAAFLGEADSDDGFEADIEVHPEKHRHTIEDTRTSGFHGESGQHDQ